MKDPGMWALIAVVLIVLISIGCIAFWALTLVNAAKHGKWVWFIMLLVIPLLCVIYGLFAYERGTPARDYARVEPRF
jgi:hypothetical protein